MRTQTAGGRKDVIYCLSLSSAGVASARMSQTSRPGQTPKEPPTPPATPPPVEKPRYEKPGAARHRRPPLESGGAVLLRSSTSSNTGGRTDAYRFPSAAHRDTSRKLGKE